MKRRLRLLKRTCGTLKLCLIALATLFVLNAIYLTNQRYRFDSTQFDPIKFVNVEQLQHSNDIQASIRTDAFAVHLHQQLIRIQRLLCGRHRRLNFSTHVRFAYSLATSDLPKSWFPSKQLFRPPVDCNASIDRQPISVRWVFEQIAKTSDPIDWTIATRHQILIKLVELLNKFPPILNADKVINGNKSDMIENRRPIILIQVHNRSNYLAQTIHSLSAVQGIDRALLIFSHDVFSVPINRLVQNIQFAATVQIFFPFSNQIYFNQFPGPSPNDCPRNHPIQRAIHINCSNAAWPDSFGHYREAWVVQTKHHWTWKLKFVMDDLSATNRHEGPFLLLEDDNWVAPDTLHVLDLLLNTTNSQQGLFTLGNHKRSLNFGRMSSTFSIQVWRSTVHNIGMVVTRRFWRFMKQNAYCFCRYDDYNWDWSLQHMMTSCWSKSTQDVHFFLTPTLSLPRVYHIGKCGLHLKSRACSSIQLVRHLQQLWNSSALHTAFPKRLSKVRSRSVRLMVTRPNGGWSDPRDQSLCQRILTVGA